jgi:hypothetical protein
MIMSSWLAFLGGLSTCVHVAPDRAVVAEV